WWWTRCRPIAATATLSPDPADSYGGQVPQPQLPDPTTDAGRVGLAALLAEPARALLGLDFDGTLAPIVPDPDAARAHPAVPGVLSRLAGHGVRVAVVTGRPAAKAVEYAGIADVEGLVVL